LVVVAIIALLISILLPSLAEAREQAKVAKCLAHLRQINQCAVQYFLDHNDNFPFVVRTGGSTMGICTWQYAGKTPDEYWRNESGGAFFIPVTERPFNPYLMAAKVEDDVKSGTQIVKRTEILPAQCPGDYRSHQRLFNDPSLDAEGLPSSYEDVGTSYHYNLHGIMDVADSSGTINLWGGTPPGSNWDKYGQKLVKEVLQKYAGSYVMFLESPMDWGLPPDGGGPTKGQVIVGNHKKPNKHSIGMLDGHAEYKLVDTRRWCGTGWSAINPNWAAYALRRPPIYYSKTLKNCNP
jgi:type II secretory pathway pseudopilin PulG